MKFIVGIVATLILGAAVIGLRAFAQSKTAPNANAATPEEVSKGLRDLALGFKPQDIGTTDPVKGPYGVVMDMDVGGKTATITSFSSGDASLYFSSGGGILGSGQGSEAVASAAKRFVEASTPFLGDMSKTEAHPLPGVGRVAFYVLMPDGIFTATRDKQALGENKDKLSPLYGAGQDVITQIRLLQERQDKERQQRTDR